MFKSIMLIHLGFITFLVIINTQLNFLHSVNSMILGAFISTGSIYSWLFLGERIILKKSIALAVSVIVFKYAILVGIFYFLQFYGGLDGRSFVLGLVSAAPLIAMVIYKLKGFQETLNNGKK